MSAQQQIEGGAWAAGVATVDSAGGRVLDVRFRSPVLGSSGGAPGSERLSAEQAAAHGLPIAPAHDPLRAVDLIPLLTRISDLGAAPDSTEDAYLRLHLLSHRLVRPNTIALDGIFAVLPNVAFTSSGPIDLDALEAARDRHLVAGRPLAVTAVDKFPRMTDYVVPSGVRIADADRVRLGAHLAPGTTVMHEGFVNFNAGTLGHSMVEGRISQGVVVGDGTDLGGGSSIMGTLSGGGTTVISLGAGCLLGANAGLGISLGDGCIVEAGLYLTAGTIVALPDGTQVKGRELSGADGLLFRRNSVSGAVQALPVKGGAWQGLNAALHEHN